MSKGSKRRPGTGYEEGWERIFAAGMDTKIVGTSPDLIIHDEVDCFFCRDILPPGETCAVCGRFNAHLYLET